MEYIIRDVLFLVLLLLILQLGIRYCRTIALAFQKQLPGHTILRRVRMISEYIIQCGMVALVGTAPLHMLGISLRSAGQGVDPVTDFSCDSERIGDTDATSHQIWVKFANV